MDYDKEAAHTKVASSQSPSEDGAIVTTGQHAHYEENKWTRLGLNAESFKRRTVVDKHNSYNQTMKKRHLNMIAIGGSIGAGLFVGSGRSFASGGPLAVLIGFTIMGMMIFNVVYALGELAMMYPISGGFYTYSVRFIDPAWGFAMGWNYLFQWAIVFPLELVVAGLTVRYWESAQGYSNAIWITVFFVVVVAINVFGTLGYAEEEFWVSILKLTTIVIFMIIALVFVLGGGPSNGRFSEYQGAGTWYNPGALSNGFTGVLSVFVNAAFAFSGSELVGLAAAETKNPQKALPSAIKQVFWRVVLFYVLSLFFVGLLVPYDHPSLLGSPGFIDVSASPFVIVARDGGIPAFASFINVVILISVVSIGLSGVYGGSRTLTALAEQGYAPKVFAYVDRAGRPLYSTLLILACGPLAYVTEAAAGVIVFDWLLALSGLAALFTWGSICLAHIRFRAAWLAQGHTVDELPFKAIFGVYGSWFGLILIVLVLIAQCALGIRNSINATDDNDNPNPNPEPFFMSFLAFFVVLLFYAIGWLWKRETWKSVHQLDVDSGRREVDWETLNVERARLAAMPNWRRQWHKIF